ncbi:MAG: hypothetical protein CSA62_12225 [Planctomycetota bacterium]|nr:MAG: hypothetical protein CSA62_12225 [Planctomycetota bacterium]
MAWESALDRLILREIHRAEQGELRDQELVRIVTDFVQMTKQRPQSWFHAAYARTVLGLELPTPGPEAGAGASRWFTFGRLKGHLRRGEETWLRDVDQDPALLADLLADTSIVSQILPRLMQIWLVDGAFERAISVLQHLESSDAEGEHPVILVEAALHDFLARIEQRESGPEQQGALRRALQRVQDLAAFSSLPAGERSRLFLAMGLSYLRTGEWGEAQLAFDKAGQLVTETGWLRSSLHFWSALCKLRVQELQQLGLETDRPCREEAATELALACEGEGTLPEAHYARGLLAYERSDWTMVTCSMEAALEGFGEQKEPDEELFTRARFYLGASLFADGRSEEYHRAAQLLSETVERVTPDLESFYEVYDGLKGVDRETALRFLDAVDLGRGASAESLLLVALEYQALGEPSRALEAASQVLAKATNLDHRLEALKVQLTAHNMQGEPEAARDDFLTMRELLLRRGALEDLERILLDEDLVGQALDHLEIKSELADLYEEMEGKDWECAQLRLQIARSLKARKETEQLKQAHALLAEVGLQYPELAQEDLEHLRKLLELHDTSPSNETAEAAVFAALREKLGRPWRVLVVGGNERQRKHHPKLSELAEKLGFEAEWLMANYTSPQKLVSQIQERLKDCDQLILLHWNRHETTEPTLEYARQKGHQARTVFYAGFTSLQICLVECAERQLERACITEASAR